MIRITIEYDELARDFKLIGVERDTLAEGDALYDLDLQALYEAHDREAFTPAADTFIR